MITGTTKLLALFGDPVEKTKSPLIHNTLAELSGQDVSYMAFRVEKKEPEDLSAMLRGVYNMGALGFNVTVPLKSLMIPHLSDIDVLAKQIGAVNTLVRVEEKGGYKGYNTDVIGLKRDLLAHGAALREKDVILLGAGGASRAAAFLAASEGAKSIRIANRTLQKAQELAESVRQDYPDCDVTAVPLSEAGLIPYGSIAIQCTSVGFIGNEESSPVTDEAFFRKLSFAYDIIYHPEETRFLALAKEANVPCANGMGMLLWQGIAAFEYWTGEEITAEAAEVVRKKLFA